MRIVINPPHLRQAAAQADAVAGHYTNLARWLAKDPMPAMPPSLARNYATQLGHVTTRLHRLSRELEETGRGLRHRAAAAEAMGAFAVGGMARLRLPALPSKRAIVRAVLRRLGILARIYEFAQIVRRYGWIAVNALRGPFWGNHCGAGNKGGAPVDTLDACCQRHDSAYRCIGVGALSQFAPRGVYLTAAANRGLAHCAGRQPSRASTDLRPPPPLFNPNRVQNGIRGRDAREAVEALFGSMASMGYLLRDAVAQVDRMPGISRGEAEALVFSAASPTWAAVDLAVRARVGK